jgi:aryl-alcohol dehydrogenase-like predicted oxidoreductase
MTIGDQLDEEGSKQVLDYFFSQGHHQLDTAILYAGGKTEIVLGKILSSKQKGDSCILHYYIILQKKKKKKKKKKKEKKARVV